MFNLKRPTKPSQVLLPLAGLVMATIVGTAIYALQLMRAQEIDMWRGQLDSLSLVMAEETAHTIFSAYLILDGIVAQVAAEKVGNARQLRQVMGTKAAHDLLRTRISGLPQIDVANIVDHHGDVINFTRSYPPPAINLSERDHFQAHMKAPNLGDFISAPVRNKATGTWTFYLSRRLSGNNGQFLGVALIGLSIEKISDFYQKVGVNLGNGATLNLYRRDFTRMIRWPHADAAIGKRALGGSAHASVEVRKKSFDVLYSEAARESGETVVPRLVATRVFDRYPLIVSISVTDEMFLANWRQARTTILMLTVVSLLVLLGATVYLRKILRQREAQMELNLQLRLQAEAANVAKTQFLTSMSHELRTPLNAVLGFSQLLETDESLSEENRDISAEITRAGNHLLTLVSDLLDLSRIESGRLELKPGPVVLSALIPECIKMLDAKARENDIRLIDLGGDARDATLHADPMRLRQAVLNLLSNAVKYNRPAGKVELACTHRDDRIRISITDTGRGIPAARQANVFTSFDRLGAETGSVEGTGIGLVITKRMVEAMGGSIGFRSAEGQGSTFWLEFPPRQG